MLNFMFLLDLGKENPNISKKHSLKKFVRKFQEEVSTCASGLSEEHVSLLNYEVNITQ